MGVVMSIFDQNWPPKAKWSVDDMPDMSGNVIIVTGGNNGIGRETVKALLNKNAKVYIASHNESRSKECIRELKNETGHEALFLEVELSDLKSIKAAVEQFQQQEHVLHVLINNAGVMCTPPDRLTPEGLDFQWAVNVLGLYYLTMLLLPELTAAGESRVVNVTSAGHLMTNEINWDSLEDGPARKKMSPLDLYNQSKFAVVSFASEFARRYADRGIVSTSLHPGLIKSTRLGRDMNQTAVKIGALLAYDPAKGALTSLYVASSPKANNAHGKYFIPWAREGKPQVNALNPDTGEKLWKWLENRTKHMK